MDLYPRPRRPEPSEPEPSYASAGSEYVSRCGYCGRQECSVAYGAWAYSLQCADYQVRAPLAAPLIRPRLQSGLAGAEDGKAAAGSAGPGLATLGVRAVPAVLRDDLLPHAHHPHRRAPVRPRQGPRSPAFPAGGMVCQRDLPGRLHGAYLLQCPTVLFKRGSPLKRLCRLGCRRSTAECCGG